MKLLSMIAFSQFGALVVQAAYYASPSSGEAYRDRRLTTNFEFWVEIFACRHVSMWGFQNRVCLSVRLSVHLSVPREKKSPYLRQYQSYISNWYINGKAFTSSTPWKQKKFDFFLQKSSKFEFWLVLKGWNNLSFVNISPTLVIDASSERSSRVLQHGNPKLIWFFFFFFKVRNSNFDEELKSP